MKIYPPEFRKTLLLLAKKVVYHLDMFDLQWTMSGGTLLGAVRAGGFIEHDYDVDFDYVGPNTDSSYSKLESLVTYIKEHAESGLKVANGLPYMLKFKPRLPLKMVPLFRFDRPGIPNPCVDLFIGEPTPLGRKLIHPKWPKWTYLTSELWPLQRLKFEDCLWLAPAHPEAILERYYGPTWETPIFYDWPERSTVNADGSSIAS